MFPHYRLFNDFSLVEDHQLRLCCFFCQVGKPKHRISIIVKQMKVKPHALCVQESILPVPSSFYYYSAGDISRGFFSVVICGPDPLLNVDWEIRSHSSGLPSPVLKTAHCVAIESLPQASLKRLYILCIDVIGKSHMKYYFLGWMFHTCRKDRQLECP